MKHKLKISFIISLILTGISLQGCNDPQPPSYVTPNEIFADFSDPYKLSFKSPIFYIENDMKDKKQESYSGLMNVNGVEYGLAVSVFYIDHNIKPGTFTFTNKSSSVKDYAVAGITINKNNIKTEFISDSGSIVITAVTNSIVSGSFTCRATESNGTSVIYIKNGILDRK